MLNGMDKSLKELGVDNVRTRTGDPDRPAMIDIRQVDLYYLHAPDNTTPIEETLSAIQELYAAGKFKRV